MAQRDARSGGGAGEAPAAREPGFARTVMRVAWLAVLLGLGMEALLLFFVGIGDDLGLRGVAAGLVKNVSWSVFVCVGLAVGKAVSRLQAPAMGVLGLLAAPAAFEVSRALHKGTLEALSVGGAAGAADPAAFGIALVKGLEYGTLGLLVGWVGNRAWGGAAAHVGMGLLIGLVFGTALVALTHGWLPPANAAAISQGVNEILFPVGCSLVLFSTKAIADRAKRQGVGSRE